MNLALMISPLKTVPALKTGSTIIEVFCPTSIESFDEQAAKIKPIQSI
jgi:hypothetical protein